MNLFPFLTLWGFWFCIVDPTVVEYPIPANDDAIKSVQTILDYFVAAIKDGKAKIAKN